MLFREACRSPNYQHQGLELRVCVTAQDLRVEGLRTLNPTSSEQPILWD